MLSLYDAPVVVLSVAVALATAALVLETGRAARATTPARRFPLLPGAWIIGGGLWSAHFAGALAGPPGFRPTGALDLNLALLLVSYPLTVAGVWATLTALVRLRARALPVATLCGALTLCAMHFTLVAAVQGHQQVIHSLPLLLLSVALATGGTALALWLACSGWRPGPEGRGRRIGAGVAFACTLAVVHYMGLEAVRFAGQEQGLGPGSFAGGMLVLRVLLPVILITLLCTLWVQRLERRENSLSRRLLNAVTDGFLAVDTEWRIIYANPVISNALGIPRQEFIGRRLWEVLPDTVAAHFRDRYADAARAETAQHFREFYAPLQRWVEVHLYPLGGQISILFRDITEQKRLEDMRAFLASIVTSAEDGVIGLSLDGRVLTWNRSAERIFGFSADQAQGQMLDSLFSGGELTFPEVLPQPGQVITHEARHRTRDGSVVEIAISTSLVLDAEGTPIGVSILTRDMTERNRMAAQLQDAEQMITVGRLAGGAAHFYNNLLTVISGNAQLLAQDLPADDPRLGEVRQILAAAERAGVLTSQLLAVGKKQVLQPRQIDFDATLGGIAGVVRDLLPETVELRSSLRSGGCQVLLDPARLQEVVLELVLNARDAMPEGGVVTLESTLVRPRDPRPPVELDPDATYVQLVVQDTGRGMDEETLSHIFQPFFTTKDRIKFPGLGLSAVNGLVQQVGGRVHVESRLSSGTRVSIFFPVARPAAGTRRPGNAPPAGSGQSILIVEDEGALRSLIRMVLERAGGYRVMEAKDGQEALEMVVEQGVSFDLLLTDIRMPYRGGVSLAQELCRRDPSTKVILISGYSHEELVEDGVFETDYPLLQKPFSMPTLIDLVRRELSDDASLVSSGAR